MTCGGRTQVLWFKNILETRFEVSTKIIGTGPEESRQEKVLNRVIAVDKDGWTYEADQRHGELIVRAMNVEGAKGVKTTGEDAKAWKEEEDAEKIGAREASEFRAVAARANYLALDRADIQYAVKEICRGMANPTRGDVRRLRRLARYLIEFPRVITTFAYQGVCDELSGYSDSDWAGCRRTARSTSGGTIMLGSHCLKSWSSTQKNITLSSGEAELVAVVKMSCELIGLTQLAYEWGIELVGNVYVDSSAALGIVKRKGNGKMRHIRVGQLWIQEKNESGEIKYTKVAGEMNPADLMTKYLQEALVKRHMDLIGQVFTGGRSDKSLRV